MISEIINNLNEIGIKVCSFGIDEEEFKEVGECIIYTYNPIATSNRFQLEIRVIAKTLYRCLEIKKAIEDSFLDIGDNVKLKKCTHIDFQGGGSIEERGTNTVHLFFYINFIGREWYEYWNRLKGLWKWIKWLYK